MTRRPGKRITRRSAAHGLDRTGSTGVPQVDDLLRAATAPGSNAELNGEADMVALFRASTSVAASSVTVRMTLVQRARARVAAAKVGIAATASVLLVGGVSYAAASGHLDDIVPGGSDDSSSHASEAPGQSKAPNPNKPTKAPKPTPTTGATSAPSPATVGNCKAYLAHKNENNPGKYLDSAAFQALIAKAGGKENLDAYCTGVVAVAKPSKKPHPTHPTHPAKPTKPAKPTQAADPTKKAHPAHPTQANNTKSPNPNKPTKTPKP